MRLSRINWFILLPYLCRVNCDGEWCIAVVLVNELLSVVILMIAMTVLMAKVFTVRGQGALGVVVKGRKALLNTSFR